MKLLTYGDCFKNSWFVSITVVLRLHYGHLFWPSFTTDSTNLNQENCIPSSVSEIKKQLWNTSLVVIMYLIYVSMYLSRFFPTVQKQKCRIKLISLVSLNLVMYKVMGWTGTFSRLHPTPWNGNVVEGEWMNFKCQILASHDLFYAADGTIFGNPLHATTIHCTVPLNLLNLLQGEGDSDAWHRQLWPADVVLWTR